MSALIMPLLGARKKRKPMPALTASGERIDLSDRTLTERIRRQRGPWQGQAWNYRELIGELGGGIEAEANVISKVTFIIGQVTDEDEPLPITSEESDLPDRIKNAAQEALEALPFRNGYAFQGVMSVCMRVAGECWLHGRTKDGREDWRVLSNDEVQPWNNGLGIIEMPGMPPEAIGKDEVLLRLWKPHPRWKQLADSPMRRLLDTCEDIVLIGREIRAASRSRIAANGILLIPTGMSIVRKPDGAPDDFQSQLEAVMLAPIGNEGDAGAVVPVVLRGDPEDLERVRHITLQREDSEELINKLEAALRRLREGMDMPPEAGTGVGDMNHWSAWLMDSTRFKNYIEPQVRLMADSLTEAYLRPSLMQPVASGGWGLTREEADQVQVWYDAGNVTENANRSTDAKDAYDRGELKGSVLRASLGFNEDDAPDEEELRRMFAWKLGADPQTAARLLLSVLGPESGIQVIQPQTGPVTIEQPPAEGRTPRTGGPGEVPAAPVPSAPPAGSRVASGAPESRVVTGAELAEIERSLRERLAVACDMALIRALERAGSKVRAAAQHTSMAAELKGLEPLAVCPLVVGRVGNGPVALHELGLTEDSLLGVAFGALEEKFTRWTTDAIKATVRTLAATLDLPLTAVSALAQTMTSRIATAWKGLEERLRKRALRKLYGMTDDELRGEVPDTIVLPGEIRSALAEIGGLPPGGVNEDGTPARPGEVLGGLATGRDVMALAGEQADLLGFVWKYGVTPRGRQFEPHRRLEGTRLSGWDDDRLRPAAEMSWVGPHYAPGDHVGCFVGETVISGARPVAGFERPFTGQGIKIRTNGGHELTGTPNHPVLTPRGWIALGELQEGDQLVVATGRQGTLAVNDEYQQMPARIDDVARTLPMADRVVTTPMPATAEHFHGDGADGEITVVRSDGSLLRDLVACGPQLGTDDILEFAGIRRTGLPAERIFEPLFHADLAPTGRGMRVGEARSSLLQRGAGVGVELSSGLITPFDADSVQPVQDGLSVDPVPSGKSLGAFAGEIALAQVVKIDHVALSGHVYNLNTLTGWYVANGVIAQNCMCDYVPAWVLPEARELAGEIAFEESSDMTSVRLLAELDDAAGRTTGAQSTRDERDRIVALQRTWLEKTR